MELKDKPINELMLDLAKLKQQIDLLSLKYICIRKEIITRYPQVENEIDNLNNCIERGKIK